MTAVSRRILAYGAVFFCVTSFTIFWTRFSGGLALVWPGTAIAAALYLTIPREAWVRASILLIVLSAVATSLFGFGPRPALPLAVVNIFEAVFTAAVLVKLRPQRDFIDSGFGILVFAGVGGLLVPTIAALPGGYIAMMTVGGTWLSHVGSWIIGHGLGTLLVMPLALVVQRIINGESSKVATAKRAWELLAIALFTVAIAAIGLVQTTFPFLFLPIVPLVLASFRFGRLGASLAVLLITITASAALVSKVGMIAELEVSVAAKALFVQFYLATLLLISLPLAVALKQRERLMAEVISREALQRLIADHSDDALLHLDDNGLVRFASPASAGLSGHPDLEGRHISAFFGEFDVQIVNEALESARQQPGSTEIIERSVTRGRSTHWLEAKIRAVYSAGQVSSFVVTVRDVTARKLDELQANKEARTDALTGLPNRRSFLDVIERQLETAGEQPFALALIDLDHFKRVNDTYGHDTGDLVLKQVADIMRDSTTRNCFFARLGGEEFGMIAMREAVEFAPAACEALRTKIEDLPLTARDGREFSITASIGVARIDESCSPSMALHAADGPLYAAKASGRNCVRLGHRDADWGDWDRGERGLRFNFPARAS